MADIAVQASFNSGEWAPALFARVDIQKYRSGAALLENFFVDYRGGASTRAGTRFIYPAPDGQIRLIPFQETSELGYVLVFTHLKLQFVSRGAVITETPLAITGVTLADPGQITVVGNAYTVGDLIFVTGVGGTTQLNDRFFLVAGLSGSQVSLNDFFGNPVDATAYGAFTSGGTSAKIYTIASPYSGTQLADIKYAQNVNQMVLCHPDQPPYLLTIVTANNWTLNAIVFGSTAAAPGVISLSSSLAAGSVNYAYQVTSIDAGGQESGPSPTGDYLGAVDLRTTGGSIQLQWSAVSGAVSYNVYKADVSYIGAVPPGSTFGFIGFTTGTTFIDSNIAPDFTITPPVPTNPFSGSGLYQTNVTTPGTYTTVPTVSVVGAASIVGSVAAVLTVQGTPTVGAGGAGYAVGDTVVFTNGVILRVATLTVTAVATWEPITSPFSSAGAVTSGSTPTNPVAQFSTSGIGTGVTANLTWGVGYLTILSPGTGYLVNPTAVFSSGAAVATITIAPAFAGNPTVPGFFQQRLVLAAQTVAPQTFYMSKPGQFFNFDVSFPTRPDDSITETLVAGVLNTIEALVSSTSGMLILTDHGSWIVNGGSSGSAVSPTTIVANAQSFNGIRTQPAPIVANYDVLYVQEKGSSVRDLSFNIYFNVFTGTDISIMPSHLFFGYQITEWAWAEEPFKVVWAARNDGVLLSCTYMKEQEFVGWAHHRTTNGDFISVATVTEPDEATGEVFVDGLYIASSRSIPPAPPPPPPPPPSPPPPCSIANVLDLISATPDAAYSTRKLKAAYAGPGLRVTRASDGTQTDIGFGVDCSLDTTALLAFCAGTNCVISKWYDQSGNARDIVPQTFNTGPIIVLSGAVVVTIGTNARVAYTTGVHWLRGNYGNLVTTTQGSFFIVANASSGGATAATASWWRIPALIGFSSSNPNGQSAGLGFGQTGTAWNPPSAIFYRYTGAWLSGHTDMNTPVPYSFGSDVIFAFRYHTTDPTPTKGYINGGTPTTSAIATANDLATSISVGNGGNGNTNPFQGNIGEVLVFNTELTLSDSNILGANQATYWGLTWNTISV